MEFSFLESLSIRTKIWALVFLAIISISVISVINILTTREIQISEKQLKTRHLVEGAYSVLAHYYDLQNKGELTEAVAKAEAVKTINAMRYDETEYFWLNDLGLPYPRMITHPTVPKLNGTVLNSDKFNRATSLKFDTDGSEKKTDGKMNLFVAAVEVVSKAGAGYIRYDWPKPKTGGGVTDELFPKLSYVKKFGPWGWVIGSGIYIDDVEQSVRVHVIQGIELLIFVGTILLTLAYYLARSIIRPLNTAVGIAQAIAKGDLTAHIELTSRCEAGLLIHALEEMNDSLVKLVSDVRNGVDNIATGTAEIASGNADLSSRTERQASSLEEAASTMEELTSTVRQNADNARQANKLAAGASDVAVKGGSMINQVVDTMNGISTSSKKIADIIGIIDGIAFQTNILALNAAVEAARAGEQGRGFAVVASEVRSLAQRSAAAAKEIKDLIAESTSKVDAGTAQVDQAGKTMDEIVASVKRVTDIMTEISAASQEQSSGIEHVSTAVQQMDEVTQQNAALVEQAAAASESLEEQAQKLAQAVSIFKLTNLLGSKAHTDVVPVTTPEKSLIRPSKLLPKRRPNRKRSILANPQNWQQLPAVAVTVS